MYCKYERVRWDIDEGRTIMEIVKDWTTVELIEFMNSYKVIARDETLKDKDHSVMLAVREELTERQPIIGWSYTL
jgi:hypothetical protein